MRYISVKNMRNNGTIFFEYIKTEVMPERRTIERAHKAKREGKAPGTQAGEFVREEMEHIREGKHGARSTRQAIAIGLSKARRAGVDLKPPKKGTVSEKTRKSAESAYEKGQRHEPISERRSRTSERTLKRESTDAASHEALSRHARTVERRQPPAERPKVAKKAVRTPHEHR